MVEARPDYHGEEAGAEHPSVRQYVNVAIVLAVVTALEVGIYYISAPRGLLIFLLALFAVMKFGLVLLWFMHLKFDNPLFRRLFLVGLGFAVTVFTIVLLIFFLRGGASPTLAG